MLGWQRLPRLAPREYNDAGDDALGGDEMRARAPEYIACTERRVMPVVRRAPYRYQRGALMRQVARPRLVCLLLMLQQLPEIVHWCEGLERCVYVRR